MGPGNHVGLSDGGQNLPVGRRNFEWERGTPIVKYRNTLLSSVQKRLNQTRCRLGYGLGWTVEIMC